MMSNEQKDRLEEFFKKLFNKSEDQIENKDWNTPDHDMWESIRSGLDSEDDDQPFFLFSWKGIVGMAALVLLILLLMQFFIYRNHLNELNNKLELNETLIAKMTEDVKNIQSTTQSPDEPNSKSESANELSFKGNDELFVSNNSSENRLEKTNTLISSLPTHSTSGLKNSASEFILTTDITIKEISLSPPSQSKSTSLSNHEAELFAFHALAKPQIHSFEIENKVGRKPLPIEPITALSKNHGIYVGIGGGVPVKLANNQFPRRVQAGPFSQIERQVSAYSTEIQFGYFLNRHFAIESGIKYQHINSNINHDRSIPFNLFNENLNSDGDYVGNINVSIPSSIGALDTRIATSRSSTTTLDPLDPIDINIILDNTFQSVSIPVIARYSFDLGPIKFSLRGGMDNQFLVSNKVSISHLNTPNTELQLRDNTTSQSRRPKPSTKYKAYYLTGIGIEYKSGNNWSFYLNPSYTQSIKPILRIGDIKAFDKNLSFLAGVRYYL